MKQYTFCTLSEEELDSVWELIQNTPVFSNEIKKTSFNGLLEKGLIQLWVEPNLLDASLLMVTEIHDTALGKYVSILSFSGINSDISREMFKSIKKWAFMNGAAEIRAVCKDAQARLFAKDGFKKVANVISLELKNEYISH